MTRVKFPLLAVVAQLSFAAVPADFPVRPIVEYANVQAKSGLRIAVYVPDEKEQKKYFARDFTAGGLLPVLVVLRNESATDSFALRKQDVASRDAARSMKKVLHEARLRALVPEAGSIMAARHIVTAINQNLILFRRELQSLTLSPGGVSSGFLFVERPKSDSGKAAEAGIIELDLPMRRLGSDDTVDFDFELDAK